MGKKKHVLTVVAYQDWAVGLFCEDCNEYVVKRVAEANLDRLVEAGVEHRKLTKRKWTVQYRG